MPPHFVDLVAKRHQHPLSSQLEYDDWAELLIKINQNSFGRHEADPMFGPWVRRPLKPTPLPQQKAVAELQPDNSRKQMIESYQKEMMQMVRNMPKKEEEKVAAFELSFRDFVESPQPKKTQPEVAVAEENKSSPRREWRRSKSMGMTGLFLIKALMPLVLAAVGGHRKVAGVDKASKVSLNPCHDKYDERSGNGSSNRSGGGSRISGRKVSCYVFLHRDRSSPIEI